MNEKARNFEQNVKFSDYLRQIGALPSENRAVNEGLIGIKPQIWPNIDLNSVFRILQYDPEWSAKMMYGDFKLKAKDVDGRLANGAKIFGDLLQAETGSRPDSLKVSASQNISCPYASDDPAALKSAADAVSKRIGQPKLAGCIRLQGNTLTVSGGKDDAGTAYALLDWLSKTDAGKSAAEKIRQAFEIFQKAKKLPKEQQNAARAEAAKINDELAGLIKGISLDVSAETAETLAASQVQEISIAFSGHYHQLQLLCMFCIFQPDTITAMLQHISVPSKIFIGLKPTLMDIDRYCQMDDILTGRFTADAKTQFDQFFSRCVEFNYQVNENTRALIKLCNADFAKTGGDEAGWLEKFEQSNKLGLYQEYLRLSHKIQEDKAKNGPMKDLKIQPLLGFKTFDDLQAECGRLGIEAEAKEQDAADNAPIFGNSCAARRVKIFRSAEHYGAEFYQNRDWTMTWSFTRRQAQVFGRPKPPCMKDDSTKVFEPANYDDWENGFDPKWKQLRDNPGKNWVKDHPLPSLNNPNGRCTYAESGYWCTASPRDTGWASGSDDKRSTLIQFMDHKDGQMYQFNDSYLLSENDETNGILKGLSGNPHERLRRIRDKYPTLNQLFEKSGFDERWKTGGQQQQDTKKTIMQKLRREGKLTRNGWIVANNRGDIAQAISVLDEVFGIIIGENAKNLSFGGFRLSNVLEVNCENAEDCEALFSGLIVPKIKLYGCENVKQMTNMFRDTVTEGIIGLDTSGARRTDYMFCGLRHPMGKIVQIPGEIDLRNCVDSSGMFENSDIGAVTFINESGVKNAKNMFVGCSMMRVIPDVRGFTGVRDPDNHFAEKGDYFGIFDGCDELFAAKIKIDGKDVTFDEYIKLISDIFKNNSQEQRKKMVDPADGFLIVNSREFAQDMQDHFMEYPGVRIGEDLRDDATGLFAELDVKIKTLDVNGCRNISRLFMESSVHRLEKIIGTENVSNCEEMFINAGITAYPEMHFPTASCHAWAFKNAPAPRKLPRITYGPKVVLDEYKNDMSEAIQRIGLEGIVPPKQGTRGEMIDIPDNLYSQMYTLCRYVIGNEDTLEKWCDRLGMKRVVQALYLWPLVAKLGSIKESYSFDKEDGFLLLGPDEVKDEKALMAIERVFGIAKLPGLRISDEVVRGKKEIVCFRGVNVGAAMPTIDLNGLESADEMFAASVFAAGKLRLTGTENLVTAAGMFSGFNGDIEPFPTGRLQTAPDMFYGYGKSIQLDRWDFREVRSGVNMFRECVIKNTDNVIDLGKRMPNLVNADRMFQETTFDKYRIEGELSHLVTASEMFRNVNGLSGINKLSLPVCENCSMMFYGAEQFYDVKRLDIPRANNIYAIFDESRQLNFIGAIEARAAMQANSAFAYTYNLGAIPVCNINGNATHQNIFYQSKLGTIYGAAGDVLFARNRALGIVTN